MTRAYNFKPGQREKRAEHMRRLNEQPEFRAKIEKMASARMRAIHAAASEVMAKKAT